MKETKAKSIVRLDTGAIQRAEWIEKRNGLLAQMTEIKVVSNDVSFDAAGAIQTAASKHLKELETIRKEVKAPVLAASRDIDSQAKELANELQASMDRIRKMNSSYATERQKRIDAERKRMAEEEAAKAMAGVEDDPIDFGGLHINTPSTAIPDVKKSKTTTQTKVFRFAVLDSKKVPDEYKTVDDTKIRKYLQYCKSCDITPSIPGVKITEEIDVRSR